MIAPEKFIQPVPTSTEPGYACCVLVSIVQIFKLKFRCLCTLVLDVKKKIHNFCSFYREQYILLFETTIKVCKNSLDFFW